MGVMAFVTRREVASPPNTAVSLKAWFLQSSTRRPLRGYSRWNGSLLARHLGVKAEQVWRVMRENGIDLARRRSWCVSTAPEFASKAADIVGLYLNPPKNAVVICMDEKPCIQATERQQGWLRFPEGKTFLGFSDRYKRNGSCTLFAESTPYAFSEL